LIFAGLAGVFFVVWRSAVPNADAVRSLPSCVSATGSRCFVVHNGRIIDRYTYRRQQHIVVQFPRIAFGTQEAKDIQLSSDGWGGKWRGHFPVGELVQVRYQRATPLMVIESNGHHRLTGDNPASDASFWLFMAIVSLVVAPFATLYIVWRCTSPAPPPESWGASP
jgi:hypothetical protein